MSDDTLPWPELRWRTLDEDAAEDYRIFRVSRRRSAHPRTGEVGRFSIVHCTPWVNVVALTPEDEVVLVRQFRHGTASVTLEIPGGLVDPGEDPLTAAARELAEETGYVAPRWASLGVVEPNPAFQTNQLHIFLALDAVQTHGQHLDPGEVIRVERVPLTEIPGYVTSGEISHALVLTAFFHLLHQSGGWRRP